jgi:hypothetical protein
MVREIPGGERSSEAVSSISSECRLDTVLEKMLTMGRNQLTVEDAGGKQIGVLSLECFHTVLSGSSQGRGD